MLVQMNCCPSFFFFLFQELLCTDPGDIMFGTKQVLGLELNEKVLYTCYPLYKMKGEEMLTCKETGQWDYAKPECIRKCSVSSYVGRFSVRLSQVVVKACGNSFYKRNWWCFGGELKHNILG